MNRFGVLEWFGAVESMATD